MTRETHTLVRQWIADPASATGDAVGCALNLFSHEDALSDIRLLLEQTESPLVAAGTFLASEMGVRGQSLIPWVLRHVGDPDASNRYDVYDLMHSNAAHLDGPAFWAVIRGLRDEHPFIQGKCMRILTAVPAAVAARCIDEGQGEPGALSVPGGLGAIFGTGTLRREDWLVLIQSSDPMLIGLAAVDVARNARDGSELVRLATEQSAAAREFLSEV